MSGANVQRRFIQKGTAYSTFFEDNYVMDLLGARPGEVFVSLAKVLGLDSTALGFELRRRAVKYIGRAKRLQRADRVEAAQAAALELLAERQDALGAQARLIWHERFETSIRKAAASNAPDVADALEEISFFTELRRPERAKLRAALWPEARSGSERERFRERELRAQSLASAARLGHSLIDLYILTIQRLGSLDQRKLEAESDDADELNRRRIDDYLDLLERQRVTPLDQREWAAFDELSQIGQNFDLILDVNARSRYRERSIHRGL